MIKIDFIKKSSFIGFVWVLKKRERGKTILGKQLAACQ